MKKPLLKLMLAFLTFFISVGVVSIWYFSLINFTNDKYLSEIPPVKVADDNPCSFQPPQSRKLEVQEAIDRAECFIIQNGYTDLPPLADRSKITLENVFPSTDDEGMKMRRDTLERKAYSYERYESAEEDNGRWYVMFRFKQHPEHTAKYETEGYDSWGRAVIMDLYGNQTGMSHTQYPLHGQDATIINP